MIASPLFPQMVRPPRTLPGRISARRWLPWLVPAMVLSWQAVFGADPAEAAPKVAATNPTAAAAATRPDKLAELRRLWEATDATMAGPLWTRGR